MTRRLHIKYLYEYYVCACFINMNLLKIAKIYLYVFKKSCVFISSFKERLFDIVNEYDKENCEINIMLNKVNFHQISTHTRTHIHTYIYIKYVCNLYIYIDYSLG